MDWTQPLTFALAVLVASIALGGAIELFRTTLASEYVTASIVSIGLVGVFLLAAIVLGARNRRWLDNPDSYW